MFIFIGAEPRTDWKIAGKRDVYVADPGCSTCGLNERQRLHSFVSVA